MNFESCKGESPPKGATARLFHSVPALRHWKRSQTFNPPKVGCMASLHALELIGCFFRTRTEFCWSVGSFS